MKQSDIDHGQGAVDAMQSAFAGRDWAMGDLEPGTNETGALWLAMTGEHDNYETVVPDVNNLYNAMGTTRMKVFKNMILADRGPDGQIQDRDVARTLIMADPIAYRVVLEQQRAALAARKIMEGSDVKAMLAIDPTFTRRERWQKPKGYTDYQWFLTRQTERYLDDNFREAESYDDLNEEGQAIYREAMGRMAPHLTVLNPNSNLDWINHDDQKDLRKTLRELIGEEDLGKKADEATRREEEKVPESPEVIALVSYLRQSPEPRIVDTNDVLTYEQAVRIGGIITAAGTDVENGWTIINAPGDGEDLTDDCTFRRTGRKCFTGATKRLLDVRNEEIGGSTEQADDHLNPIGKLHKEVNKYKRRKEEDFAEREEQVKRFKKGSDALGVVVDKEDARIAALQAISRARVSIEDMGTVASDDLTAQGILQVYVKNQSKAVDNLDTATIESRAKRRLYRREFKTEIADDHEPNNLFMKLERDPPEVNSGGKNDTDLSDQITIVRQGMVSVEDAADALHQRYQTDDKAVKDEKKLWKELMADDRNFDDEMESELRDTDIALKRDGSRWVLEDEKGNKYRSFKDMTASHKVASDGVSKAKQASDTRRLDTSKLISPTEVLRRLYITDPVLENQVRPKKERAFRAMASALMLTNMARNERVYNNRMNRLAEYARQGGKVRQAAG
ncbi:hypothetical protein HN680_00055, partial [Candidatus Peregrinibacteria bacterium]|nr:hypothetical protein [Candidatus Peregrinibacteria bacterium]